MEKLAPEIISAVISYLTFVEPDDFLDVLSPPCPPPLAQYATISRRWQSHIEQKTFRSLVLTPRRLVQAEVHDFLSPIRLSYLRELEFNFVFPRHDVVSTHDEDWDDQAVFLRTVKQLFSFLHQIPLGKEPWVKLDLSIPVPRKFGDFSGHPHDYRQPFDAVKVAWGAICITYFDFSPDWEADLPELPMISALNVTQDSHSLVFAPRSLCLMTSKMTRLKTADFSLGDIETLDLDLRIQQRNGLANALEKLPASLTSLDLRYEREMPRDHSFQPPSLIPSNFKGDSLSLALHQFMQRDGLEDLTVAACIDSTMLWPEPESASEQPLFPTLKVMLLSPHGILPSGQWLGIKSPQRGLPPDVPLHHDNDISGQGFCRQFRDYPDYALMDRFFLNAGRCMSRMPKVESIGILFNQPLEAMASLDFYTNVPEGPCLIMAKRAEHKPSEETLEAWREAARVHKKDFWLRYVKEAQAGMYYPLEDQPLSLETDMILQ
ncbi:hypothetical protein NM208_g6869 [Fusarium decemcellulare]|uniref:Uncharacterized protein n=1 Tax=Fusarium decemcellulare TaxID=57161 RepID=A0ACC1SBS0_9HYPO|nr:hypothetical protein NM208_g6869 [Fusarium decemcellulare]